MQLTEEKLRRIKDVLDKIKKKKKAPRISKSARTKMAGAMDKLGKKKAVVGKANKLKRMRQIGTAAKSKADFPKRVKTTALQRAGAHKEKAKLYLHGRPGLKTALKVGAAGAAIGGAAMLAKKMMKRRALAKQKSKIGEAIAEAGTSVVLAAREIKKTRQKTAR